MNQIPPITNLVMESDGNFLPPVEEDALELSIVMPCLSEAEMLATCIEKAQRSRRYPLADGSLVIACCSGPCLVSLASMLFTKQLFHCLQM